jgi:molybdate transport system substrate-binding protein
MRRFAVIVAGLAAVTLAGCSSSGSGSSPSSASSSPSVASTGTITVFAAASLMGTFTQLGEQFDTAHPGDTVKFSFGPSSGLATQITSGAPADVFASAAPANMDSVVKAGDASNPQDFAKNTMEVATPPKNPGKVTAVNDLAKKSVKVALCQPQVPCGVVAAEGGWRSRTPTTPRRSTPSLPSATASTSPSPSPLLPTCYPRRARRCSPPRGSRTPDLVIRSRHGAGQRRRT